MESIRKIFRIGKGPSSSHTMGPQRAAQIFRKRCPDAAAYKVILYGSLAATGKGHLTDEALHNVLGENLHIVWKPEEELPLHPNGLTFVALDEAESVLTEATFYSTGGGAVGEGEEKKSGNSVYPLTTLENIIERCMDLSVENGLQKEGFLPGRLKLRRKARQVFLHAGKANPIFSGQEFISAYALAVTEENASGGVIVTAPTCGSSGVIPAVLKYFESALGHNPNGIIHALATAGLIGAIVKHNASISGAEAGCQAEIGTACAMAAASAAQLLGADLDQIEYAAEMGLEHHLGLTCDPVYGLVQIPCIERNAFAANRAVICANYAIACGGQHRITFDDVVQVMLETGTHMAPLYRETSTGGLATRYQMKNP